LRSRRELVLPVREISYRPAALSAVSLEVV
jgi:hypothetical protein